MIAIDWSHTKDLTTYDGKKLRVEDKKALLTRIKARKEPNQTEEPNYTLHFPTIVLEQGCPLPLAYSFVIAGVQVFTISNRATQDYRVGHSIEKTDENDAKIIWGLAQNRAKLEPLTLDNKTLQMHDLYHQYCRYQKARVAMQNMKKAHKRQYGDGESNQKVPSNSSFYPSPDFLPYDIAIDTLHAREKSLLKKLEETAKGLPLFEMAGGESMPAKQSILGFQPPTIKGLGKRIWLGLMVTANPASFKCLSAYLRFCGLVNLKDLNYKYNRHAKMLYHMLAEEVMKQKDSEFRQIYDKCKADIAEKYPEYTKGHIHNAALNRTATFLAKRMFYHCSGKSMTGITSTTILQPLQPSIADTGGKARQGKQQKSAAMDSSPGVCNESGKMRVEL